MSVKHFVEGVTYTDLKSISVKYGINYNTLYKRYSRGKRNNDLLNEKEKIKSYKKPVVEKFNFYGGGIGYKSSAEACRQLDINYGTYRKRLSYGYTSDQALGLEPPPIKERIKKPYKQYSKVSLTVEGVLYTSYTSLAKAYNLPAHRVRQRIVDYGYTPEEAISQEKFTEKSITFENILYNSKSELARAYNKTEADLRSSLLRGLSLKEALGICPTTTKNSFHYDGNFYTSLKDFSDKHDISYSKLQSRLNSGLSLTESLENKENIKSSGFFNETRLKRDVELSSKKCILYLISFYISDVKYYKVGITTKTIEQRFYVFPYEYTVVFKYNSNLLDCYNKEQYILKKYSDDLATNLSSKDFEGYSETFKYTPILLESLKEEFKTDLE